MYVCMHYAQCSVIVHSWRLFATRCVYNQNHTEKVQINQPNHENAEPTQVSKKNMSAGMYVMGNPLEQKKQTCIYLSLKSCTSRSNCTARASVDSISINSTGSGDYEDYQGAPVMLCCV